MKKKESYVTINGIQWTPERVKSYIINTDNGLKTALLRVYSFQTEEEQKSEQTVESNGKGFNGTDAEILSSFAKQLIERGFLSPKQIVIARKKMVKYSRQIYNYIESKREQVYEAFNI